MKYMVGLQFTNNEFTDCIISNKEHIDEVYFAWSDFPNGRNNQLLNQDYYSWEIQSMQIDTLTRLSKHNIPLNVLFNANCYGAESQAWSLFEKIGNTVNYLKDNFTLHSLTTTSPLIARFIKANFSDVEVRASVNMEIGSIEGIEYLSDYFDSFYIKRELNRDIDAIKKIKEYTNSVGKKIYGLANSGCLNNCSAHNFHDNLVAHENEISKMNNAYEFQGICKEYLKNEKNYSSLITKMNFIRPEDIDKYNELFVSVKLATRVHKNPIQVLESYINRRYSGDILRILEPMHNIYPYIIENGQPLALKKLQTDVDF